MGPFLITICQKSDPVIRGWKFKFVFFFVMRRSHIADYGHHFRSERSRHETRNSRITILTDLGCPIIVWTQSFTYETESKHSRQVRPVTFGKLDFVWSDYNRDYVVTLRYRIEIVTMSCIVWTISGWCPMELAWSGQILHCRYLPIQNKTIFKRLMKIYLTQSTYILLQNNGIYSNSLCKDRTYSRWDGYTGHWNFFKIGQFT